MKFTYFKLFSILNVILLLSSCKTNVVNTEIATVTPKPGSSFTYSKVNYDSNGVETSRETETDSVVSSLDTFKGKSNIITIVKGVTESRKYSYELNGDISWYIPSNNSGSWCTFPVSTQKESTFSVVDNNNAVNYVKELIKFLPGADLNIKVGNDSISTKGINYTISQEAYLNKNLISSIKVQETEMNFSKKIGYIVREATQNSINGTGFERTLISYSLK